MRQQRRINRPSGSFIIESDNEDIGEINDDIFIVVRLGPDLSLPSDISNYQISRSMIDALFMSLLNTQLLIRMNRQHPPQISQY